MFPYGRALVLVALAALLPAPRAAEPLLPPVDGEFSGEFTPSALPNAPVVRWQISSTRRPEGIRQLTLLLSGNGTRFRSGAELALQDGSGRWKVDEAVVDMAVWGTPIGAWLGASGAGAAVTGELTLSGQGTLVGGLPQGELHLAWKGSIRHEQEQWALEGVVFEAVLALGVAPDALHSARPAVLRIGTITTSRFGARNLEMLLRLVDTRTLQIESARIEIAGGEAELLPARVPLEPLNLDLQLRFTRVGLQDIVALVPGLLSDARGRVDGRVRIGWNEADGLKLGEGAISLRADEAAEVKLASMPGLITDRIPAGRRQQVLEQYPGLGLIEQGKVPLRASLLEVTFTPAGDAEGRTAYVHLVGGPVDPKLKAPVDLELNVRGPIEPLIKLGTDSRFRFGKP